MAERRIEVDHLSVHRCVIKLVPLFEKTFRRIKRPVRKSWRKDETYIKVKGRWKYGVIRQLVAGFGPLP